MHELHRPCRIFPDSVYHLINLEKKQKLYICCLPSNFLLKHKHNIAAPSDK